MKPFGLIGGTSWHSTMEYYRIIHQQINKHFGNNTNPLLYMVSLNQNEIHQLQNDQKWDTIASIVLDNAQKLEQMGALGIALCANTPHKVIPSIQNALHTPFIHIADAMGIAIQEKGWTKIGLVGTRFTMEDDFIKGNLLRGYQIECIVPTDSEQQWIQQKIVEEFSVGIFSNSTRALFLESFQSLNERGAQAIIMGCTEIPLLFQNETIPLPTIDSMQCHCDRIVHFILSE
ncbi:MAG: amino acid racemase [Caldisericia bacterium]|nr:amino acid racemase [Caldisericia bacterium]MDD4614872.1 amino acid racemase [Caldisericia bacterium]